MEGNTFAATAYQASLSRRELSVELAFRIRDLHVRERRRTGASFLSSLLSRNAKSDSAGVASSLLKVFAAKREEGGSGGFSLLGGQSDYVEVYSSEIQAPSETPHFCTTLLLDIPRVENLAVPIGIDLRIELYVSTKTSKSARKFMLYGQANMTLTDVFHRCGYPDYSPVAHSNPSPTPEGQYPEPPLPSAPKRPGWGAWPLETLEHSLCILDIRIAKPPRLFSMEIPNYSLVGPTTDKLKSFSWRAQPPLDPGVLVGFVHAPISRAFAVPSGFDAEDEPWHHNRVHRESSNGRLSIRSRLSSAHSLPGGLATSAKPASEFVEFREEMAELPLGLLVPSLYLKARATEVGRAIAEFRAEVQMECLMLTQQVPRMQAQVAQEESGEGSPREAAEDLLKQCKLAVEEHEAWRDDVVERWQKKKQDLEDIAEYYEALWKNCTVGERGHPRHSKRSNGARRHSASPAAGRRAGRSRHVPGVSNGSRASDSTASHVPSSSAASGPEEEAGEDLITSLRHTSSRLAVKPDAPVFIDAFMGGGGGAEFPVEQTIPEKEPQQPQGKRLSIRRHRRPRPEEPPAQEVGPTAAPPKPEQATSGEAPMDITFRSSTTRQNWRLRHLPVNLHLQVLAVHHTKVTMANGSGFYSSRNVLTDDREKESPQSKGGLSGLMRRRGWHSAVGGRDFVNVPAEQLAAEPDESDTEVFSQPVKILPRGSLRPHSVRAGTKPSVQTIRLAGEVEEEEAEPPPFAKYYDFVTVGAATAHHLGFDSGGLRGVLDRERGLRDAWHRMRDDIGRPPGTRLEAARRWHETQLDFVERQDTVFPQALAAVTSAIVTRLHVMAAYREGREGAAEEEDEHESILEHGFLVGWESLLSTTGKERGMLEDLSSAVEWVTESLRYRVITAPRGAVGVNCRIHRARVKRSQAVFEGDQGFVGAATSPWLVTVLLPAEVVKRLPPTVRNYVEASGKVRLRYIRDPASKGSDSGSRPRVVDLGALDQAKVPPLKVTCLLFTQGINEAQSLANVMKAIQTNPTDTIQEEINLKSCQGLFDYCSQRFKSYQPVGGSFSSVSTRGFREESNSRINLGSSFSSTNESSPDDLLFARQAQARRSMFLLAKLRNAVRQQTSTEKNLKILGISGDLVRWLNGIRMCSCKSAKDRTSMSVTLEESRMLVGLHQLKRQDMLSVANVMREHGVRLINVYKNTKSPKYAFNGLQRAMLPQEYKPPNSTIGSLFRRGNAT